MADKNPKQDPQAEEPVDGAMIHLIEVVMNGPHHVPKKAKFEQKSIAASLNRAVRSMQCRRWTDAVESFQYVSEHAKQDDNGYVYENVMQKAAHGRAQGLRRLKLPVDALKVLSEHLGRYPNDIASLHERARIANDTKQYEIAEQSCMHAIGELQKRQSMSNTDRKWMAHLYIQLGDACVVSDIRRAIQHYQKGLVYTSGYIKGHARLKRSIESAEARLRSMSLVISPADAKQSSNPPVADATQSSNPPVADAKQSSNPPVAGTKQSSTLPVADAKQLDKIEVPRVQLLTLRQQVVHMQDQMTRLIHEIDCCLSISPSVAPPSMLHSTVSASVTRTESVSNSTSSVSVSTVFPPIVP
jgi:hypothetical protein